jgi:hypothetical protein
MSRPNQFLSPEGDLEDYFVDEYWLIDQWVGDTLLAWGQNYGSLGDNQSADRLTPVTTFAGGSNWKQVAGGGFHTAAIKTDGTLWVWGNNIGQLGTNTTTQSSTPVTTFAGGNNWKQVACGVYHTAAIKTDGTLWLWGNNNAGQLGDSTLNDRLIPSLTFSGGTNWKQVTCGNSHTAAIKTDGTLWIWGYGNDGILGNNNTSNSLTPITTFAGGNNWKLVSAGPSSYHTAAIKTDGTLWVWGANGFGAFGALGDNSSVTSRCTPSTTFAGGTNWKQVACARESTAAVKTDGTLWIWGRNYAGRIGDNTTTNKRTPVTTFAGGTNWKQVSIGYDFSLATKTDGTLWGWGANYDGRVGINNTATRSTPVTTFAGGTNWKQVSAGYYHSMAVTSGTDPTFFIT